MTENTTNQEKKDVKTITINLKEEYKIKIEKAEEFDKSIFSDIYRRGFEIVAEIIGNTKPSSDAVDNYNNVIAFTGERGKGKTSAMVSFQKGMNSYREVKSLSSNYFEKIDKRNIKFATIDYIDPSIFNESEGLLKVVITKMFQDFKRRLDTDICQERTNISVEDKRELIAEFNTVYSRLKTINFKGNNNCDGDSIESLIQLSTGSDLREAFRRLVDCYLKIIHNKADYLVLAIDDFDLNHWKAYEMLEDLRKFLIQPNIILLIAAKMSQLNDILLNKNFGQYRGLILNGDKENITDELRNKAQRYLDKLIPNSRRLELPSPKIDKDEKTFVMFDGLEEMEGGDLESKKEDDQTSENEQTRDFQDAALELIFRRSGFFISKPRFKTAFIIPDTLRGYLELVRNFRSDDKAQNSKHFQHYLENDVSNDFDGKKIEIFRNLKNASDDYFVIVLLNSLYDILEGRMLLENQKSEKEKLEQDFKIERFILKAQNPNNISISDLQTGFTHVLKKLRINSIKEREFIEFLKVYTSIRIHNNKNLSKTLLKGGFINEFTGDIGRSEVYIKDFLNTHPHFLNKHLNENHAGINSSKSWLIYFLPLIGGFEEDFRLKDDDVYDRRFSAYKIASYSLFFAIISPYVIDDEAEQDDQSGGVEIEETAFGDSRIEEKADNLEKEQGTSQNDLTDLVKAYIKTCDEKEIVLKLFSNLFFVESFTMLLNRQLENSGKSNRKSEHENFGKSITEAITKSLEVLEDANEPNKKGFQYVKKITSYNYLKKDLEILGKVVKSPVFKFWKDNNNLISDEIQKLIDLKKGTKAKKGSDSNQTENDTVKIDEIFNKLNKSIQENKGYGSRTLTIWINRLPKLESGTSDEYKTLTTLRNKLRANERKKNTDGISETKKEINSYLKQRLGKSDA